MSRPIEDIKKDIESVKESIFYEQMADFMNWNAYYTLEAKLKALQKELAEAENES